jgi:acyl-CoA synthetase (AMP-forming)/AMP-acid ligase II
LAYFDEEGFLHIQGRMKAVIVTPGGKNISPEEVEIELLKSPYIQEVLVWGGGPGMPADSSGARYRLADDTWVPMTEVGAPSARLGAITVWTGSEMIVWGGFGRGPGGGSDALADGARYRP